MLADQLPARRVAIGRRVVATTAATAAGRKNEHGKQGPHGRSVARALAAIMSDGSHQCGWIGVDGGEKPLTIGSSCSICSDWPHCTITAVQSSSCALACTAVSYTHLRAHETPEHLVCR